VRGHRSENAGIRLADRLYVNKSSATTAAWPERDVRAPSSIGLSKWPRTRGKAFLNRSNYLTLRQEPATYTNPILPAHSANPWMIFHNGRYYYCESRNQTAIHIRKSNNITDVAQEGGACVWTPPRHGQRNLVVRAPELHFLNGKWYIYFAANGGENENYRMWVLESQYSDPIGPYTERGCLETGGCAADGTVLTMDDGRLYFIWSGWPGKTLGRQNLYIAPMKDPCSLAAERTLICQAEQEWETVDTAIVEAPQILKRNGMIFVVYSANGSWTVDYCLGLLINRDGDVMNPCSWEKRGPVLGKTPEVWGVGHCSFVRSPDQTEDWILYHAKSKQKKGWLDRRVHAQRFSWYHDGLPHFGRPLQAGIAFPTPSCDI
jgi:GH43 family beta-xylosidase